MVLVAVLSALLAALVVGGLVAVLLQSRLRHDLAGNREATVRSAVAAAGAEAAHVLSRERQATVEAAVHTVVDVASSKLGDSTAAGSRELDLRTKSFEAQVAHVTETLGALANQVADLQKERAEQSGSLVTQLQEVSRTQQALAEHTGRLREALASPKQRGQWGERMAEDVLRAAGMEPGVNYLTQTAIPGGTIPDFRFLLPGGLELRMDVKFPVDNYLRVLDADSDADGARFTKAFLADVRGHVRSLADRGYIDPSDTVDCLLLFIPNEAVYTFLHETDRAIVDVALGQRVILCSPSTLFAVLAVVRRSVEQFQLTQRSDEILRGLGSVTSEWDKLAASIDKVGRLFDQVSRNFHDDLNGTRRRVFQRALDDVASLSGPEASPSPGEEALTSGEALVARKAAGDVRSLARDGATGAPTTADDVADAG